jgi:hypothetical protein
MVIGRLVAWVLLLAALVVLARDMIGWYDTGRYAAMTLGALRAALAPGGPASAQAAGTILAPPAWAALAIVGIVLLVACRRRSPRTARSRRRRGRR